MDSGGGALYLAGVRTLVMHEIASSDARLSRLRNKGKFAKEFQKTLTWKIDF